MADNMTKGTALGWDDEGEVSSGQFEVLPAGEYTYEVTTFKRERFGGSERMSACPVAALQLRCTNVETGAVGTAFCRLYLNSKVLWRISQFFKSCGLVAPDAPEGASMPMSLFDQCTGRTGAVKVEVRKSRDGKYDNNEFTFRVPSAAPAPAQQTWGGQGF